MERSTDQVIKSVNVGALSKWVGKIPSGCFTRHGSDCTHVAKTGYDPYANPPNYGKPDPKILEKHQKGKWNFKRIEKNWYGIWVWKVFHFISCFFYDQKIVLNENLL